MNTLMVNDDIKMYKDSYNEKVHTLNCAMNMSKFGVKLVTLREMVGMVYTNINTKVLNSIERNKLTHLLTNCVLSAMSIVDNAYRIKYAMGSGEDLLDYREVLNEHSRVLLSVVKPKLDLVGLIKLLTKISLLLDSYILIIHQITLEITNGLNAELIDFTNVEIKKMTLKHFNVLDLIVNAVGIAK